MKIRNAANDAWVPAPTVRLRNAANTQWDDRCVRLWDGDEWVDVSTEVIIDSITGYAVAASIGPVGEFSGRANAVFRVTPTTLDGLSVGIRDIPPAEPTIPWVETGLFEDAWKFPAACSAASDFEAGLISAGTPSNGTFFGPGVGFWTNVSLNPSWTLENSFPITAASVSFVFGIRRVGMSTPIATAPVTMTAIYGP